MKALIGLKITERKCIDRFVSLDCISSMCVSRVEMCYTIVQASSYRNNVVDYCCSSHKHWRGK
jgi:hypothetical protein